MFFLLNLLYNFDILKLFTLNRLKLELSLLKLLKESQTTYAYRGSDHEDDDGSKSKFGPSGYYPGKYFYMGDKALPYAQKHGKSITRVDISNAKLYPITYKNQDKIELEAGRKGFTAHAGGQKVVDYLKSLGYDGIARGLEVILFDHQKFNPQKISSLSESTITESYESQKELEWVVEDILSKVAYKFLTNSDILTLPGVDTMFILSETDKQYTVIEDFLSYTNTRITFHPIGNNEVYGEMEVQGPKGPYNIRLFYTQMQHHNIRKLRDSDYDGPMKMRVLNNDLDSMFGSTLLHELQHAYDGFISDGEALKNTQDDINRKKRRDLATKINTGEFTPEEEAEYNKSYNDYLNYTYEINARFAQTIKTVRFIETVYGDSPREGFSKKLVDWNRVVKQFKGLFRGWDVASDKMKKRLVGRLYKIYNRVKDEFERTQ
jgi:hypothetical protein